jgi:hypothetical protein
VRSCPWAPLGNPVGARPVVRRLIVLVTLCPNSVRNGRIWQRRGVAINGAALLPLPQIANWYEPPAKAPARQLVGIVGRVAPQS